MKDKVIGVGGALVLLAAAMLLAVKFSLSSLPSFALGMLSAYLGQAWCLYWWLK